MRRTITFTVTVLFIVILLMSSVSAQVDTLKVSYQGYLTDNGGDPVPNASYNVTFRIFDQLTGGTLLTTESHSVSTSNGLFNIMLHGFTGDQLNPALYPAQSEPRKLYLEIQLESNPPISPRVEIGTVPHSIVSRRISGDVTTGPGELTVMNPDDTTTRLVQTADNDGVSLVGEEGDDIYSTELNGTSIATNYTLDGTDRIKLTVNADGPTLFFFDDGGDTAMILGQESNVFTGFDVRGIYGKNGIVYLNGSGDTTVSLSDAVLSFTGFDVRGIYSKDGIVYINDSGDTTMSLSDAVLSYTGFDVRGIFSQNGILYVNEFNDTTVNISSDGIIDLVNYLSSAGVNINDTSGTRRVVRYQSNGVRRFETAVNQTSEEGSNTGSDFVITRFDDSGSPIGPGLFIERSTGEVGIATNTPAYTLDVQGTIGGTGGLYHSSDRRLKKDIKPLPNAMDRVSRLRGVSFNWRTDEYGDMNLPEGRRLGLIAQEVEEVVPEVVSADGKGFKAIEYSNLVALLIEGMKEQQQQINGQNEKIKTLQKQVTQLSTLVQTLATNDKNNKKELAIKK